MARKKKDPTPAFPELEATRHKDTRKNIPTEVLRDSGPGRRGGTSPNPRNHPQGHLAWRLVQLHS